ncbi:ATP-binding protein, partial [Actinopolymorpha sp. B11F2]|uniref:ATP-binding protein n=1 Tax=Actinopolymorpha sp. B11F2 TaxID=3160862 RepID=UPI0032E450EE
ELLHVWDQPHLDALAEDARLVISELVTNAVLHGGDNPNALHLAITDGSLNPPVVQELTSHAEHGRGLAIIEQLTTRWGIEPDGTGGKRVWVELGQHNPSDHNDSNESDAADRHLIREPPLEPGNGQSPDPLTGAGHGLGCFEPAGRHRATPDDKIRPATTRKGLGKHISGQIAV